MKVLISVPVWGDVYFSTFQRAAAPALIHAAERLRGLADLRFMIHTDQPGELVRSALPGFEVDVVGIAPEATYVALQESHAAAINAADAGDRVVLLNADLVVSGNFLEKCLWHLGGTARAVVLLGIRTLSGHELPPAGAQPRDLLAWAWGHRHQIISDLEWPAGGSMVPTNLFFTSGDSTVARGFHLHPAAIVKHRSISFKSTIDGDLLDCFPRDTIYVVVDPDDCSMCEISSAERRFPVREEGLGMTAARVAASMRSRASATHCWLFSHHRIVVRGLAAGVVDDELAVKEIMEELAKPEPPGQGLHYLPRRQPRGRRGMPIP